MNSIDRLSEIFSRFPGIGPRQAKRFVYYLLSQNRSSLENLVRAIENLNSEIIQCKDCKRFFAKNDHSSPLCSLCTDSTRDKSSLMVVPRDVDLEAIERSGGFHGYYFVLGGSLPILEKEPEKRIRINELRDRIKISSSLSEVILAMNATPDGENTADFLKIELQKILPETTTITVLGRGLSTGAELEYADPDTLKNALLHRTK